MKALLKKVHQHVEKKNVKYAFQVKKKTKRELNQEIGFACICAKKDFLDIENQN
jgi:hypothetical protein